MTTTEEKIPLLCAHGADRIHVLQFDTVLAQVSAEDFVRRILVEELHATQPALALQGARA